MFSFNKNNLSNLFIYVILWVLFTSAAPFTIIESIEWHPYKFLIAFYLGVFCILFLNLKKIKLGDNIIVYILMFQMAFGLFAFFYHGHTAYINLTIQMISLLLLYVFIVNFIGVEKTAKSIVLLMSIISILGVIAFILAAMGILEPLTIHESQSGRSIYNFGLTYSNSVEFFDNSTFIRIAGFFDEPGHMAFFIVFALLLNKLYLKNSINEIILVFGGLFTFSLAFYITIIVYFLLFYLNKQNYKLFIIVLIVISISITLIYTKTEDFADFFDRRVIGRFEVSDSEDRVIRGDNRSVLVIRSFEAFLDSPLMGQGTDYRNDPDSNYYRIFLGANFLSPLAIQGIVGFIFMYLHVFYLFGIYIKRNKKEQDLFYRNALIIIFLTYLQRPSVIGLITYTIIILLTMGTVKGIKNNYYGRSSE